jgi:hypothetical protein
MLNRGDYPNRVVISKGGFDESVAEACLPCATKSANSLLTCAIGSMS